MRDRARILFVNHTAVLGGGELCLRDIASYFRDGSAVLLFADGPFRALLESDGVTTEVLSPGAAVMDVKRDSERIPVGALWGLARLSVQVARRSRHYDMLYANSQKAFIVAALVGFTTRRRVIWHLHDILNAEHFSAGNIRTAVFLANNCATRVIANSRATAEAFIAAGGRGQKVVVIHNGIAPERFGGVNQSETEAIRHGLGIGHAPLLGVFGRLHHWKGQHVALAALASIPGAHLLVVGDALFGEVGYREELRALASQLGVAHRVHWLGFRKDIPELMAATDIVLHTSVAPEPFGRVIVEAMLSRRPVVATLGGGANEIVQMPETGRLIPPGDPGALAEAVRALLDRPDQRLAMGRAGRARAEAMFGLQAILVETERVIESTLGSR